MRVLLADESETMRTIVRRTLESLGVSGAIEATEGAQALELFRACHGFDLVITDWNMPGKNGVELVHEVRALDADARLVMITSEADKRRVMEAIEAGVSEYLIKPFSTELLRKKLEQLLAARK